jgi:hypothetical protein
MVPVVIDGNDVLTVIQDKALPIPPDPPLLTKDQELLLIDAGPVFRGEKGETGPSLYDLWLEAGNVGSLDDFLAVIGAGGGGSTPIVQKMYPLNSVGSFVANHGLAKIPTVKILTVNGEEVETDVLHSPGKTTLIFPVPFIGTLYLE